MNFLFSTLSVKIKMVKYSKSILTEFSLFVAASPRTLATGTPRDIFSSHSVNTWQVQATPTHKRVSYFTVIGPQISISIAYTVWLPWLWVFSESAWISLIRSWQQPIAESPYCAAMTLPYRYCRKRRHSYPIIS